MAKQDKLTDRFVRSLTPPTSGQQRTYDSEVKGFGVRITAKGAIAFFLNYYIDRRERRFTIGSYPDWSVAAARDEAKALKREIDMGRDPMAERNEKREAPTIKDLWERYKKEHLPTKADRSASDDEAMWRDYILPSLSSEKLANVSYSQISRLHAQISMDKPVRANHVIQILRKAFNLAIQWEWAIKNPCEGIKMNTVESRERFARREELEAIFEVMAFHKEQTSCDAIRLIILTGARKGETLKAKWSEIDFNSGTWTKPSAHTKQKKLHRVPLSKGAIEFLQARYENKVNEWIFPSPFTDGHLTDFKRTWDAIRQQATLLIWKKDPALSGFIQTLEEESQKPISYKFVLKQAEARNINLTADVTDLRVHDLRHTYASILASQGHSLPLIGALLGHTQAQTTKRYAHLLDDPLREATNGVEAFLNVR